MSEARRLSDLEKRGLRYEDAAKACEASSGVAPTRKQVNYSLQRLAVAGRLERRDGYVWYLKDK